LIYLTDGCGTFPDKAPDFPVLWVCTTDVKAPAHLGQTIAMK
jgi:predicted metal-dependent peptidase